MFLIKNHIILCHVLKAIIHTVLLAMSYIVFKSLLSTKKFCLHKVLGGFENDHGFHSNLVMTTAGPLLLLVVISEAFSITRLVICSFL